MSKRTIEMVTHEERQVNDRLDVLMDKKKRFYHHQMEKDDFFGETHRLLADLDTSEISPKDRQDALEIQSEYQRLERLVTQDYEAYETTLKQEEHQLESRRESLYVEKQRLLTEETVKQEKKETSNGKNGFGQF